MIETKINGNCGKCRSFESFNKKYGRGYLLTWGNCLNDKSKACEKHPDTKGAIAVGENYFCKEFRDKNIK